MYTRPTHALAHTYISKDRVHIARRAWRVEILFEKRFFSLSLSHARALRLAYAEAKRALARAYIACKIIDKYANCDANMALRIIALFVIARAGARGRYSRKQRVRALLARKETGAGSEPVAVKSTLKSSRKYELQTESMSLWARSMRPSAASVTSTSCSPVSRLYRPEERFLGKVFHTREKCSPPPAADILRYICGVRSRFCSRTCSLSLSLSLAAFVCFFRARALAHTRALIYTTVLARSTRQTTYAARAARIRNITCALSLPPLCLLACVRALAYCAYIYVRESHERNEDAEVPHHTLAATYR